MATAAETCLERHVGENGELIKINIAPPFFPPLTLIILFHQRGNILCVTKHSTHRMLKIFQLLWILFLWYFISSELFRQL